TLDDVGNRLETQITDPNGTLRQQKQQVYNLLGRLIQNIDTPNHTTDYSYDANGNLTQVTDANLHPTAQAYDALDRLQQTIDALNGTTQFTYDDQDNLTSVIDPNGLTTTYDYDYLGNLISQTSPDTGTTSHTYDEAGNRLTQTDARGITVSYSYDALNRLTQVSYPDSSLDVSYTYDQGTYGTGRLSSMTDAQGTTSYSYNAFGQPLSKTRTSSDNITTVFSYAYDTHGRLANQTYPSGRILNYSYDAHGQLNSLSVTPPGSTTQSLAQNIQRLPFGPIQTFDYGNGLSLNRTFDLDYQLTQQTISGILQSNYLHDPVGNITDWEDLLDTGRDQQFSYDQLDRLASASGVYGSLSYGYDATGNRLSLSDGTTTETYSYVPNSHRLQQILGSVTDDRTYDAAGNTIQSLIGSYTYDDTNRMVGFSKTGTQSNYAYNGKGERIQKAVNGVITRYRYGANAQLMGEYDINGSAIREYVYLSSQPLVQLSKDPTTQAETVHYLHTDHLGGVVKATDSTQTLVWDAQRKPFGEWNITTAQITMPLGFPGQVFDDETGTYYNYFRDYDPATGRYLQSDPIGLRGGLNTFAYGYQNPVLNTDPKGLDVRRESTGAACGLHERVAVDVSGGQFGVSFGHTDGAGGGLLDYVCPGCYGSYDGVIYEDGDPTAEILDRIETKPCQDKNILKWLQSQIGNSYSYSLNGYNCRTYSVVMMMLIRQKLQNGEFNEGCKCQD
ncbi:MAG: hypothetical protein KZQ77_16180, partial [Candidatus Thiodiazotropha sp. (ex Notomyrtea botanica)]|nr:hypothetical protein [Candidatus Thiodiazotropha sp. (ex Notomyrtea botanica)]